MVRNGACYTVLPSDLNDIRNMDEITCNILYYSTFDLVQKILLEIIASDRNYDLTDISLGRIGN